MTVDVLFEPEFQKEFDLLPDEVQDELLARVDVLERLGPQLGRPTVDTLVSSSFPNMKELRFKCNGVWRFAFAFDTSRNAIVLCGGDKEGADQRKFYRDLIAKADARFAVHLKQIKKGSKKG